MSRNVKLQFIWLVAILSTSAAAFWLDLQLGRPVPPDRAAIVTLLWGNVAFQVSRMRQRGDRVLALTLGLAGTGVLLLA